MTINTVITALLILGWVAAAPVLYWGLNDLSTIPGGVWRHSAQRPRRQWQVGMIGAYAFGGWPAMVAVIQWRHSHERANLLKEWAHLSARKRRHRQRRREEANQAAVDRMSERPAAASPGASPGARVRARRT